MLYSQLGSKAAGGHIHASSSVGWILHGGSKLQGSKNLEYFYLFNLVRNENVYFQGNKVVTGVHLGDEHGAGHHTHLLDHPGGVVGGKNSYYLGRCHGVGDNLKMFMTQTKP